MKLHQSLVLKNLAMFNELDTTSTTIKNPVKHLMRGLTDMFLIWKTVEYFQPKKILEIGVYAGQTLGLMYEASGADSNITSIDIKFNKLDVFNYLFPDANINFIKSDSIKIEPFDKFDFIHIDGYHSYEYAMNDIVKSLEMSHTNTIISIDDYEKSKLGVKTAIDTGILEKNDFIPFLLGDSSIFFHHASHRADEFIDHWIQEDANNFIHFSNINFGQHLVLRPHFISQYILTSRMPGIFERNLKFLLEASEFYNL